MRRVSSLVVFGLSVAAVAMSGQQRQDTDRRPQTPAFRSGVDVVSLNVTVTDAMGRFVRGLTREAFVVYEDGVHQELRFFNRGQTPIALALLIDTSASMDEEMTTAQEAAIGFSRRLRPEDLAEIIDFDNRVDILQGFTNDVELLERAIGRTSAGGATVLYNALYISLKELKQAPVSTEEVRREAIVVLSDGADTHSVIEFDEVLDLAKRSETANLHDRHQGRRQWSAVRVHRSRLRAAPARSGDRWAIVLPQEGRRPARDLRADLGRAVQPIHLGVHLQQPTPGTGSGDGSSCVLTGTR